MCTGSTNISVQDNGIMEVLNWGWTTWAKRVFRKRYTFLCYRASQSRGSTRWPPFTAHVKPSIKYSNFCVCKFHVLFNFVYWIIYEIKSLRILLYVTFITTKVSRSTVYTLCILWWSHTSKVLTGACTPKNTGWYIYTNLRLGVCIYTNLSVCTYILTCRLNSLVLHIVLHITMYNWIVLALLL